MLINNLSDGSRESKLVVTGHKADTEKSYNYIKAFFFVAEVFLMITIWKWVIKRGF